MHCLDEGVDVPSASKAIFMCNSSNPREFIQRIGRVLRRHPDKKISHIYDMVVKPPKDRFVSETERKIFEKECIRCDQIGDLALNCSEYLVNMYDGS